MMLNQVIGSQQFYPATDSRSFVDSQVTIGEVGANDLLVQVLASAVNPIDIAVRKTLINEQEPRVLGFDAVAIVQKVGKDVDDFQPGDRIFYAGEYSRAGSNAQYQIVDQRIVALAPQQLTDAQAAAMPLTALTAYELLFEKLNLTMNVAVNQQKTILIINGAGGVGSSAIQLAKLCGLRVFATASRPESIAWVKKMGADDVLNHHQNLVQQARAISQSKFDYLLVLSNADDHWAEICELIQPATGIIGTITNLSDHQINDLKRLSVTFAWEWMFAKTYFQTANLESQGRYLRQIALWLDQGLLQSTLTQTVTPFNAAGLKKATQIVESHHAIGKVVLTHE
ncbi:zinc-binding alcohol dehydrogenase family protein [Bombilactobacillus folatiphilus]|uniref:Zinc-type alcohol dehydrogenase-like protein n=1 Tax=Bombilactobacillus folatiphilus TaxID=2923362 RepID=A0ABY4P9V2_9LACO|nr:zinc-binding alcohol dehydrogenase family protein [Bombilactobacillus folatiphilus]UQS82505.1 zinc-binding alcohol dehydrogenase family protein [Bombilactobacillus folatiphilus]